MWMHGCSHARATGPSLLDSARVLFNDSPYNEPPQRGWHDSRNWTLLAGDLLNWEPKLNRKGGNRISIDLG